MAFRLTQSAHKYRDVRGHILRLPSGVICVPTVYTGDGYWSAVTVGGRLASYGAGAPDIAVFVEDIDAAERIEVK